MKNPPTRFFQGLSLRQRFLVAPLLTLVVWGLLTAAFIFESQRQNALLSDTTARDLAAFNHYSAVFTNLTEAHMALYELLRGAGKNDEATLYDQAKLHIYKIQSAVDKLEETLQRMDAGMSTGVNADFATLRDEVRDEALTRTQAYREGAVSALEMATLNLALAPAQLALANERFTAMNSTLLKFLDVERNGIRSEIAANVRHSQNTTHTIALIGISIAVLLFALSLILSRLLSRSIESQIIILTDLGEQAGARFAVVGSDEVDRITQAIAAFRQSLLDLRQSRDALEQRGLELKAANDELRLKIEERAQAENALRESEERYRQLFELSPDGILIHSEGKIALVNSACVTLLGAAAPGELIGKPILDIFESQYHEIVKERIRQLEEKHRPLPPLEEKIVRSDGATVEVETVASPFTYKGKPSIQTVMRDITERKKATERMAYLAQYDSLTGLPNRNLFRDRLTLAMARARRNERLLAVMFLGLDHFKDINDTFGHTTGDEVLQAVTVLLGDSLRGVDTIARFGGDEFAVIVENVAQVEQVTTVAERLKKVFSAPVVIQEREIFVTASVGITIYPLSGDTIDALLQMADIAMYHAKKMGRNTYEFYTPELNAQAGERLKIEALLRRALERNEFVLHYQPKVETATGKMVGVEALIRWNSKELGLVPPVRFIPLAEETGLIGPIGEWVIKTACAQSTAWQAQGSPPLLMSVNLSLRQLRQKNLVEMISGLLDESGLAPQLLEIELTESLIMENIQENIETLKAIRRLGVNLAIDDFGTGYSSLGYLAKLPVQTLKIDRSFIVKMQDDADAMTLVSTILTMAHSLRLKVVAEGVETKEQAKVLRLLRCDELQGYLISKPLPSAELSTFFDQARQSVADPGKSIGMAGAVDLLPSQVE